MRRRTAAEKGERPAARPRPPTSHALGIKANMASPSFQQHPTLLCISQIFRLPERAFHDCACSVGNVVVRQARLSSNCCKHETMKATWFMLVICTSKIQLKDL